jgi:hypothetical protein
VLKDNPLTFLLMLSPSQITTGCFGAGAAPSCSELHTGLIMREPPNKPHLAPHTLARSAAALATATATATATRPPIATRHRHRPAPPLPLPPVMMYVMRVIVIRRPDMPALPPASCAVHRRETRCHHRPDVKSSSTGAMQPTTGRRSQPVLRTWV